MVVWVFAGGGEYDRAKDSCQEKLSDLLISLTTRVDPSNSNIGQLHFSKKSDTPELLKMLNPEVVKQKCPLFREFYTYLRSFCSFKS